MKHFTDWAARIAAGTIAACVALSFVVFQPTASATDLTTRATKGSALTYNELDANFDIGAQNKTASYPIAYTDNRDTIEFDGSSLTATLPDVATVVGQADTGDFQVTLVNLNASALTVARTGTDTIGGGTSYSLPQWASATFKANNGTDGWNIINAVDIATNLNVTGATTLDGNTTIGDASGDALTFNPSAWTLSNAVTITGTWTDLGTVTTADINGGTYDGGAIATSTVAATTLSSSGNTTIGDAAGDAFTINPSAWTLSNAVTVTGTWADLGTVTTADINGGTIDGTTIGGSSAAAGTFTTGTIATADINGGAIDGTAIGGSSASTGAFTTLSATGAFTSTRACAAGYSRITPNLCMRDVYGEAALTRDSCTTIARPSANANALLLYAYSNARSQNSAGSSQQTTISAYTTSGCSTTIMPVTKAFGYEFSAVAGKTLSTDENFVIIPVDGSGNIYLRLSDDAGNQGSGGYSLMGYLD